VRDEVILANGAYPTDECGAGQQGLDALAGGQRGTQPHEFHVGRIEKKRRHILYLAMPARRAQGAGAASIYIIAQEVLLDMGPDWLSENQDRRGAEGEG
jgi:hypothetical protein